MVKTGLYKSRSSSVVTVYPELSSGGMCRFLVVIWEVSVFGGDLEP